MKVKVKKRFRDKYTHTLYPYGATLSLPEARVKEILSSGDFLEIIPAKKKETPAPATPAVDECAEEKESDMSAKTVCDNSVEE